MNNLSLLGLNPDFTVLSISGAQAQSFVQGQFTCDVNSLQTGKAIAGACCDHKGRMLVNGWLGQWDDQLILALPKNMLAQTLLHLQKFAVFSKVSLNEQTDWAVLNYIGPGLPVIDEPFIHAQVPLPQQAECFLHWLIGPSAVIQSIQTKMSSHTEGLPIETLSHFLVMAHLVFVQPETRELFIPQMIGLEKLEGVSFNKGCYVGQEVITRIQHLGELKRHLQIFRLQTQHPPKPGDPVLNENNEIIGHIATVSTEFSNEYLLLAVIQDRALSKTLFNAHHDPLRKISQ